MDVEHKLLIAIRETLAKLVLNCAIARADIAPKDLAHDSVSVRHVGQGTIVPVVK